MTPRARAHRRLLAGALLGTLLAPALLTGCAESVDPIERLGRKAAEKVPRRSPGATEPGGRGAGEPHGYRCGRQPHTAEPVPREPRAEKNRCPDKAGPSTAEPGRTPEP